jgi:hypothetical protein
MFRGILLIGTLAMGAFGTSQFLLPTLTSQTYERHASSVEIDSPRNIERHVPRDIPTTTPRETRNTVVHVPLPKSQKVIYMTSCVVGTPTLREKLVSFIETSEVNAVIIDIKDFSGTLSFDPQDDAWNGAWNSARCGARDMREFITTLHTKGIYVIGRITVFQDPFYTLRHPEAAVKKSSDGSLWKDFKGLSFIDVGYRPYWDHVVDLARISYNAGFDELNFDYIRYPSDGNMKDIAFTHSTGTKQVQLETFFMYLNEQIQDESRYREVIHSTTGRHKAVPYTSADIFGMTTTNTDDLSIGQVLERTLPHFDFVAPMVYPSHYPPSFLGLGDPNKHVYKVIHYSMGEAVRRAKASTTPNDGLLHTRIGTSTPPRYAKPAYDPLKLRSWIQDFDYGGTYDVAEVRAQIQATYDVGLTSFMVWDPANRYTRGAYGPKNKSPSRRASSTAEGE